jgi:hypothetical protein
MSRDPRLDPRSGDWLSLGRVTVRVDFLEGDVVFFVRWFGDEIEGWPDGIALADYRAQAADAAVVAEGIPGRAEVWVFGEALPVRRSAP